MSADDKRVETTLLVTVTQARPVNPFHRVLGRVLHELACRPGREARSLQRRLECSVPRRDGGP